MLGGGGLNVGGWGVECASKKTLIVSRQVDGNGLDRNIYS